MLAHDFELICVRALSRGTRVSPGMHHKEVVHSTKACVVWAARLRTERGELVRLWEYDRYNGTVFQVDLLL